METLFIVFAFIGMFASGFFACMLLCFGMVMFKQDEQLKKRRENECQRNGKISPVTKDNIRHLHSEE